MNIFKNLSNLFVILLLVICSFYGGFYFGKRGFVADIKRNPPTIEIQNKEPKGQNIDFRLFWQVWDSVNKGHIDRPLDAKKLMYGAVSGMVASIGDDYTSFFDPKQNELATSSLNGTYEGIGAELGFEDKQLIIVSPIEGSPAEAAGVKPGDKLIEIEGKGTVGITLAEAVSKIRGPANTSITLKLQRGDSEPKEVKITRGKIVTKSVTWKDLGDDMGYIRLSRFGDTTADDWTVAITDMKKQMPNLKGVVLDVRGNPGGYLTASVYVVSEFVPKGAVIYEERADGTQTPLNINRKGVLYDIPVVVLIDKGSASASEIVAGALRDHLNAKLVGVKSFGKGTIQTAEEFVDGSSVHITIAKWLTPNKIWVHKNGLEPDVTIERSAEDTDADKDTQLDKAKEVLKGEIK